METQIMFVQLGRNENLEALVKQGLEKINRKYNDITNAIVRIKKGNGDIERAFICEMEIRIPGEPIFAVSKEHKYEAAVAETLSDVERQLRKRKEKLLAH